jgi:hypothetical protein
LTDEGIAPGLRSLFEGELKGLAAPEAANNAVCGAGLTPLVTLGIPGALSAAVIMGAFMIHIFIHYFCLGGRSAQVKASCLSGKSVDNIAQRLRFLHTQVCFERSREGRGGKISASVCVCRASEARGRRIKYYGINFLIQNHRDLSLPPLHRFFKATDIIQIPLKYFSTRVNLCESVSTL